MIIGYIYQTLEFWSHGPTSELLVGADDSLILKLQKNHLLDQSERNPTLSSRRETELVPKVPTTIRALSKNLNADRQDKRCAVPCSLSQVQELFSRHCFLHNNSIAATEESEAGVPVVKAEWNGSAEEVSLGHLGTGVWA